MAGQNKASMRKKLRSALAHKKLADEILDSIKDSQTKWNSVVAKLAADNPASLDTNYVATNAITDVFEADGAGTGAQHKETLRKSLRSALAHRSLANELADAIEEMQVAHNALLAKLDAEAGTLNDVNYASTLSLSLLATDSNVAPAQHHTSLRKSLSSALTNESLADSILDSIKTLQTQFNAVLAILDTSVVTGIGAKTVTVISPDA